MDIDINLLMRIKSLNNLYLNYLNKADEARRAYGKASSLECQFLQMAADQKDKLIHLTNGSGHEMMSHMRDLDNLNKRIKSIRDELEPNRNRGNSISNNNESSNNTQDSSSSSNENKDKASSGQEDDDDIDTSKWIGKKPEVGLDKVSGMESVKDKLRTCMIESELKKLAARLELQTLNSFFFVGPPGCGKTFIINAFVHDLMEKKSYNYLTLDCSQIITKYVGDSEKIVKKIFEEAVRLAPCILFIDEIDGMCKNRSNPTLPEYASSLTTAFLTSYNIIKQAKKEIVFIGATNYPKNVDEAMMDRVEVVYVGLPDSESREKAFKMSFKTDEVYSKDGKQSKPLIYFEDGLDEKYMSDCTRSYNYRDIERLVENIKKQVFGDLANRLKSSPADIDANAYVDRMIKELDSGEYVLTKEVFNTVLNSFSASNKTSIIKEIKEWMDEMRRDDESSGASNFPNLENHPDYLESLEAELAGGLNGQKKPNEKTKAKEPEEEEEDVDEEYEDAEDDEISQAVNAAAQAFVADAVKNIIDEALEESDDIEKKEEKAEKKISKVILCEDEFTVDPDGQVTVHFYITSGINGSVIGFVGGKAYNCTVSDDGLCEFRFTPNDKVEKATVKIMDAENNYGDFEFGIVRGISDNQFFDDFDF